MRKPFWIVLVRDLGGKEKIEKNNIKPSAYNEYDLCFSWVQWRFRG